MTRQEGRTVAFSSELARHGWWLLVSTVLAVIIGLAVDALIPALIYAGVNNLGTWLYVDQIPAGHGGRTARVVPCLAAALVPVGLPLVLLGTNGSYADRSMEHTLSKDAPAASPSSGPW
jgi:hypothetical protein